MKNLKTWGLFALTMLGSCQKQEKTNATDIDTTTFTHAQIPEEKAPATLPEGYVWCVQSQQMFEQQFGLVATVYKDSNDICTPCTMIVDDLAQIPVNMSTKMLYRFRRAPIKFRQISKHIASLILPRRSKKIATLKKPRASRCLSFKENTRDRNFRLRKTAIESFFQTLKYAWCVAVYVSVMSINQ